MASIYPLGIVWRHGASDNSKAYERLLQMVHITVALRGKWYWKVRRLVKGTTIIVVETKTKMAESAILNISCAQS